LNLPFKEMGSTKSLSKSIVLFPLFKGKGKSIDKDKDKDKNKKQKGRENMGSGKQWHSQTLKISKLFWS